MNQDEYNALAARHGGEAGKSPINPTVKDATSGEDVANPNPIYRYVFKDGTYVEARDTLKGQNGAVDLEVTNPGTALKADDSTKPTSVSAPATEKYIVTRQPDNTLVAKDNPNYKGDGKDPASSVTSFGDQLIGVYDDGKGNLTTKVLLTKDPTQTLQAVTLPDGSLGSFNPKDGTVTTIAAAGAKNPGTPVKGGDGKFYIWDPKANNGAGGMVDSGMPSSAAQVVGTGADDEFTYAIDGQGNEIPGTRRANPNFKKPGQTLVGTDPNSEFSYAVDKDGNEVAGSRRKNPNYVAPKPTELTGDTISAVRGLLQPDGTVKWVPNEQRLTVNQAMADLMDQAGMKVTAGSMSMDDAKNMLTGAVNLMNAQSAKTTAETAQQRLGVDAASNMVQGATQGAQAGASLLSSRVNAATGALNNILGLAGQGQRSGNMGGGLMSAPAGLGENLVQGLTGWTAELGGGQGTYDAAANLVKAADPTNQSGMAAQGYAALSQMLQKYRDLTGSAHPAEDAIRQQAGLPTTSPYTSPTTLQTNLATPNPALAAANQANASGFNPQASTAALNARGLLDNPQGRAIAAGQVPVATTPLAYPGQWNTAYQQAYPSGVGMPATGPVVGQAVPFIAPTTVMPPTATVSV